MKKLLIGSLIIVMCLFLTGLSSADKAEKDSDLSSSELTQDLNFGPDFAKKPKLVAGGIIRKDATLGKTWRVVSCTWSGNRYEIQLKGPASDYFWLDFIAIITPKMGDATIAASQSVGGKFLVYLFDSDGNNIQDSFQFLIYKCL